MIKLILFDFDGTLVSGKNVLLELVRKRVESSGYKINKTFMHKFGDAPLKKLLKILKIRGQELNYLDDILHKDFFMNAYRIKPSKSIMSLKKIKQEKIIVTNAVEKMAKSVLKNHRINFFSHIYTPNEFKNKISEFRAIIKRKKLKPSEVIYIGDRPIDVKIARQMKFVSVIVSNKGSWSPKKEIIEAKPDFIIGDLSKLKKIAETL